MLVLVLVLEDMPLKTIWPGNMLLFKCQAKALGAEFTVWALNATAAYCAWRAARRFYWPHLLGCWFFSRTAV